MLGSQFRVFIWSCPPTVYTSCAARVSLAALAVDA